MTPLCVSSPLATGADGHLWPQGLSAPNPALLLRFTQTHKHMHARMHTHTETTTQTDTGTPGSRGALKVPPLCSLAPIEPH